MGVLDELMNRFLPARQAEQVAQLAQRLAREQQPRIGRLLAGRARTLGSHAEARGYIGCRARGVLSRGLARLAETAELSAAVQQRIMDLALELTFGHFTEPMLERVEAFEDRRHAA